MPKRARDDDQASASGIEWEPRSKHTRVEAGAASEQSHSGILRKIAATTGQYRSPLYISDSDDGINEETVSTRDPSASSAQGPQSTNFADQELVPESAHSPDNFLVGSTGREHLGGPAASQTTNEDHNSLNSLNKIEKMIKHELKKNKAKQDVLADGIERSMAEAQKLRKEAQGLRELSLHIEKFRERT